MKPWKTISSQVLIRDRWIKVRIDSCVTASGISKQPYYALEYPDWVNIVVLTPELEIVMVRQYRHGVSEVLLELPSGTLEPADNGPAAAVSRELMEETGFKAEEIIHTGRAFANPAIQVNSVWSFLALDAKVVSQLQLDPGEGIEVVLR